MWPSLVFAYFRLEDGWYNWHHQPFWQWWFVKQGFSKSHGFMQYPGGSNKPLLNPLNGKHFNHIFMIHLIGQQKHCFRQSKLLKHLHPSPIQLPMPLSGWSIPKIVWIRRTTTKILLFDWKPNWCLLLMTEITFSTKAKLIYFHAWLDRKHFFHL